MCSQSNPRLAPAGDLVAILHALRDQKRSTKVSNRCWCRLLLSKSRQDEILVELKPEEPCDAQKFLGRIFNVTVW